MRVALIVTTYDRPDALARVLASVAAQSRAPDEIAIADDGSGPDTAAAVRAHAASARCPVHHVWQAHDGFRVARARNAAIARTRADYLMLVDGDMVLDREFVADHVRAARPRRWVQGPRLPLGPAATRAVLAGDAPERHRASLDGRHRAQSRRSAALAAVLAPAAPALLAVKACNQGVWRRDVEAVNGFDEAFVGWGAEDKDFAARLHRSGVRARGLLFGALAWHLHHPPASRDAAAGNAARLAAARSSGRLRCETGLDRHPATG